MADSFVPSPNDGTTRKLASKTRTQGADTVHDQSAIITDGAGNVIVPLEDGGEVVLSAATLAALETIDLGAATLAALETIGLDAATLAALETIDLGATTLAALESITVGDGGGSLTVDGPVTDGQIRATPLPVSGTVATGGLTDTELRAAPVSVEQATSVDVADGGGSLTVDGPLTDAQLAARLPLSVEQATSVAVTQDEPAVQTATFTASGQDRDFTVTGYSTAYVTLSGTYGTFLVVFQGSDGLVIPSLVAKAVNTGAVSAAHSVAANATVGFQVDIAAVTTLRINSLTFPSGTCNIRVSLTASPTGATNFVQLGAGTANIGDVDVLTLPTVATSAVTNVSASTSNVTLKASNASRKGLYIQNDGTGILYVKLGATATATTSYSAKLVAGAFWELPGTPLYTGIVDGIWSATGGNGALITELSA